MKINICSKLKDGIWGGGNQFLRALQKELILRGIYTETSRNADVVVFNSYQDSFRVIKCWFTSKDKKIVYRLGPIFYLHRGMKWIVVDYFVILVANFFSDLIIFQSKWSYNMALNLGLNTKKKYRIINNSVDDTIFFKNQTRDGVDNGRISLVYTSWSSNPNKGYSYLEYLDKNLDFKKFTFKFIGNSPVVFQNIQIVKPLQSKDLAVELRRSDIYVSPTKDDACSNAILEALSCGLPVVALDSGANRELVNEGGAMFKSREDLLATINSISGNLNFYKDKICVKNISNICDEYLLAIEELHGNINF
jgi:glycosyltransferase involved in cell wall biosynthesis